VKGGGKPAGNRYATVESKGKSWENYSGYEITGRKLRWSLYGDGVRRHMKSKNTTSFRGKTARKHFVVRQDAVSTKKRQRR